MIILDKKIQKCKDMTSKHTKMCFFEYKIEDISRIIDKKHCGGLIAGCQHENASRKG
jgi:hypothetical protein